MNRKQFENTLEKVAYLHRNIATDKKKTNDDRQDCEN